MQFRWQQQRDYLAHLCLIDFWKSSVRKNLLLSFCTRNLLMTLHLRDSCAIHVRLNGRQFPIDLGLETGKHDIDEYISRLAFNISSSINCLRWLTRFFFFQRPPERVTATKCQMPNCTFHWTNFDRIIEKLVTFLNKNQTMCHTVFWKLKQKLGIHYGSDWCQHRYYVSMSFE